jgi:subtilase family serine protease
MDSVSKIILRVPYLSCNTINSKKIIAGALVLLLVFILGISSFGLYGPRVYAATGPDLVIQDITLSPQDPAIDNAVTITVTVINQGTAAAGHFDIAGYMDNVLLATKTVSSLDAGLTASVTFSWTAQKGSHVVKAIADSAGVITEPDETNNIKTFNFSTLAVDLRVQSVSWSPQSPSKGDPVVFTAIIQNQGSAKSSPTDVKLYVDGALKDPENIDAINPGSSLSVALNWVAGEGQHTIRVVVDEGNHNKESDETNNEQSFPFSTMAPDLTISTVTWTPQVPSRNDVVSILVTVKNQGSGRAEACHLAYYIDDLLTSETQVAAIGAGASSQFTFTWTALSDTHKFKFVIDYYQVITESNENNNEYSLTLSTSEPDLVVKDITWSPQNAGIGDVVTFTATIKNQGGGDAGASRMSYYINNTYQGFLTVPALDTGKDFSGIFKWTAELSSVMVTVNVDLVLGETRRENNTLSKTIPIIQPDLMVDSVSYLPANPAIGDTVTFKITVKNHGGGKANDYNVGYYIDGTFLDSNLVDQTASGASVNMTFDWQVQNGRHTFKALADYTNLVDESNEKNNDSSVTIVPFMPDLAIGTVTWTPLDTPIGSEVTFEIGVQNTGTFRAGSSRLVCYVDNVISGFDYIGSVDPGITIMEHFTWIATAGSHTIQIVADANNQVTEVDETNNTKVVSLPPPDLTVQSITVSPPNSAIGDKITITCNIANQGNSKTQDSAVNLYIDDTLIESRALPPIDAGSSLAVPFSWTSTAGNHTIKIIVDPNNTVIETNEANNEKEMEFSVLTPDLVVQDLRWETNSRVTNNQIDFTVTVQNIGSVSAGTNKLEYIFDNMAPVYKDIPLLQAGQATDLSFSIVLSPGSHTAIIIADANGNVTEFDETNNENDFAFNTVVPDLIVRTITWTPLNAKIGDKITITAKIDNQGAAKAIDPLVTLLVDGAEAGSVTLPEVDVDTGATADFPWTLTAGRHEISVIANSDNAVRKHNTTNNVKTRTLSFADTTVPVKSAGLPIVPSTNKGFLGSWWWILLLLAAILGIGAFVVAYRAAKNKY